MRRPECCLRFATVPRVRDQIETEIEEGTEVWLKLPGFEVRRSRVVWVRGKDVGCEFQFPLHPRELELLAPTKPRKVARDVFRRA